MTPIDLLDASRNVLAQLADVSGRTVLLALVAALAVWAVRLRSAPARHAVWTVVLCGMLILPVLNGILPPVGGWALREIPVADVLPLLAEDPVGAEARSPSPAPARDAGARLVPPNWPVVALCLYLAVAALLLGRLLLGCWLCRRLARTSAPIRDPRIRVLMERLVSEFPPPPVEESEALSVPITVGWLEPVILLPPGWRDWGDETLKLVLVHELSHVRRRDWLIALLAGVNKCLFWFHPLAWWLERKLAALAEESCDDSSLLATRDRDRYADVLLGMASAVRRTEGRFSWHATAMARPSQVRKRIDRILDETRTVSRGLTHAGWAAVLLCSLPAVYGAASVQWSAPEPAQTAQQAEQLPRPRTLEWLVEGYKLTPAEVQQLEQHLVTNPEDLAVRSKLTSYYYQYANREQLMKHIVWLVEHHPESELSRYFSNGLVPHGGILNDESDYLRVKELWLRQIERHRDNPQVLANAASIFEHEAAIELLKGARRLEPANRSWILRMADLYAHGISVTASGRLWNQDPALGTRLKEDLANSTDAELLGLVGTRLTRNARRYREIRRTHPEAPERPELAAVAEYGEQLIKRAETLGWTPSTIMPREATAAPASIRVGANVQGARLINHVAPVYPPLAQRVRLQGTVRLTLTIDKEGRVRDVQVVNGHPLLVPAAHEAVRQWVYQPTLLNGQPVEVITEVDVPFRLAER